MEDFKATKRSLKKNYLDLERTLETVEDTHEFNKLSNLVTKARELKMATDKQQAELQKRWEMLDPSDRA